MDVRLKRAYEPASPADGYRVLIDRLWPRGVSRRHARLDDWGLSERRPIMLCYVCAERGTDQPAVALCRGCNAGLCLDHLRATAAHLASSHILDTCHHDTWTATERPAGAA